MTVRRLREHCAGFSINALGFAGFLLCTERSDRDWLEREGPWALLEEVAATPLNRRGRECRHPVSEHFRGFTVAHSSHPGALWKKFPPLPLSR